MEFRACVVCDEKCVLQVSFCLIFEGQQRKVFFRATEPLYFVFCRLYPFSPPPDITAVFLGSTCHLSTLDWHCIAGAGLPNHMMGEVSWDPKRRRSLSSYIWYLILSVFEGEREVWEKKNAPGAVKFNPRSADIKKIIAAFRIHCSRYILQYT